MQRAVVLLLAMLSAPSIHAATMYISDALTVPMRSGPSSGHRIIHAALTAGTPLETLGSDQAAGFTRVRLQNGTDGWVPTQFLTAEPIARDRLAAANRRIQSLETELKSLRENFQETRGARASAESRSAQLDKQTQRLQAELDEIRRVSGTAVAQYEENKSLKAHNEQLKTQTLQLTQRVQQLERNQLVRFFLLGGGLVLVGLISGVIIKSRPRRGGWS